jgi:uncharacterized membrane protein YfcA
VTPVNRLCIFTGTLLGGYAGWALGDKLGFDLIVAFILSGAGSLVGVYAGWKVARKLEE